MSRKQPTSTDVAKRAGVSQTTVSFVLNKRADKYVAQETRDRVLTAAKELRYRSNKLSHGILRGKSGLVGVVLPLLSDTHFSRLLTGISDAISNAGLHLLLCHAENSLSSVADSISNLMEYRVNAILSVADNWGSAVQENWLEEILVKRIPLVIIDDRIHSDVADSVISDDVAGAELAVNHLVSGGHRRIAHLSGGNILTTSIDRRIGYLAAVRAAGISEDDAVVIGEGYDIHLGNEAAQAILDHPRRPTAVFAANDKLALEFLRAMRLRGLECPRDIAVVGYGDTDIADALDLTSVSQDSEIIGKEAIRLLQERMLQPDSSPRLLIRPTRLIVRGSSVGARTAR